MYKNQSKKENCVLDSEAVVAIEAVLDNKFGENINCDFFNASMLRFHILYCDKASSSNQC